jgi:hypothetical protein
VASVDVVVLPSRLRGRDRRRRLRGAQVAEQVSPLWSSQVSVTLPCWTLLWGRPRGALADSCPIHQGPGLGTRRANQGRTDQASANNVHPTATRNHPRDAARQRRARRPPSLRRRPASHDPAEDRPIANVGQRVREKEGMLGERRLPSRAVRCRVGPSTTRHEAEPHPERRARPGPRRAGLHRFAELQRAGSPAPGWPRCQRGRGPCRG